MWLPSLIGLAGNVAVDAAAKAALTLPHAASVIPYSDFKPLINSYAEMKWQKSWDKQVNNKLLKIQPQIGSVWVYRLQC
jgi:hypothetical protein